MVTAYRRMILTALVMVVAIDFVSGTFLATYPNQTLERTIDPFAKRTGRRVR